MANRIFFLIILQLFSSYGKGQETISFHPPLDIPMYLSGNFGEIRTNHFHSGIDIKTQGSTGHRVYAVEVGYVSRIKVQANGYGKSIYISHPNGFTSVYGHLDRYREDIAAFVKRMQYKQKSHTVDLYLEPDAFPLEKGEHMAFSGNTGSSSGPHLHFEIRSSANQHPTNVLAYNFNIKDRTPPRFRSLYLYPMDKESQIEGKADRFSSKVVHANGTYRLPRESRVEGWGSLGISVEVFDYLDGTSNRCGIYTLEMYVDEQLSYKHVMDEFSFSETRYINAHIDYQQRIRSATSAHRLHRLPNDRLRIYGNAADNRAVQVDETRDYPVRIVASDVAGNQATLEFIIQGRSQILLRDSLNKDVIQMDYRLANTFQEGPVRINIPARALYQDLEFTFSEVPASGGSLSPFYQIASAEVPVHLPYTLSIDCPDVDPSLRKRLTLVTYNDEMKLVSAGGAFENGAVVAKLSEFGTYAVGLDTIAPEIVPLVKASGDCTRNKELRFAIRDALSGISRYEGYIDDRWALFEYDPKNELLVYVFDEQYITRESEHELELYVSDAKGNVNLFHSTFNW